MGYLEQRRGMPGGMPETQRLRLLDMVRHRERRDQELVLPKVPGQRHIHITGGCSVWPQELHSALGVQPALHFRRGFLLLSLAAVIDLVVGERGATDDGCSCRRVQSCSWVQMPGAREVVTVLQLQPPTSPGPETQHET